MSPQDRDMAIATIKDQFLKKQQEYNLIYSEISNCARYIKVWQLIAEAKNNSSLNNESFWGWMQQYPLLRQIVIDSYKIFRHTMTYIKALTQNILTKEQNDLLIKNSKLRDSLKQIGKIVEPLKDYRNKRYAHLENIEIQNLSCNLGELWQSLKNIENSIYYIYHHLVNPRYIIDEAWQPPSIAAQQHNITSVSNDDYVIRDCKAIIEKLN